MSKRKRNPTMLTDTLRQLVKQTEKSVTVVAREAGIPQPVLHRFMTGERGLTLPTVEKLFMYFGLEVRKAR
jgi:plasmid maintenance system antidote protein VapI